MLEKANGKLSEEDAMNILKKVAHRTTTWSAVYNLTTKEILVTVGKKGDIYIKEIEIDFKI